MSDHCEPIRGDIAFPRQWTVFGPFDKNAPPPALGKLCQIPESLKLGDKTLKARSVTPVRCQFDFRPLIGAKRVEESFDKVCYAFLRLRTEKNEEVSIGFGADYQFEAWMDGQPVASSGSAPTTRWPPLITHFMTQTHLSAGDHILAVRFLSGKGSAILAIGGPRDLREGDYRSVLDEPFFHDPRWRASSLQVAPVASHPIEIGSRLELFVDDFLIDGLKGDLRQVLHHPVDRGEVFRLDAPWENPPETVRPHGRYFTLMKVNGGYRLYYMVKPSGGGRRPRVEGNETECMTCLAESRDGLRFERKMVRRFEIAGSRENNVIMVGRPGHNLTPFLDPTAAPDAPYKAVADHPMGGGLGAYASADGIEWKLMVDHRILAEERALEQDRREGKDAPTVPVLRVPGFDSQNLAFHDANAGGYLCYFRSNAGGLRRIMRSQSPDFIHWSEPEEIRFPDDRMEHLYTNAIHPYPRAPHLYIGTPLRLVPERTKITGFDDGSLGDAIFMSSRDGLHFTRFEEGFIRPGMNPGAWLNRKNEPAWGMMETAPGELSVYWREDDLDARCVVLKRGTLRTDGFVSLQSRSGVGELLTKPLRFQGSQLIFNYATSAIGSIRTALCDESGRPLEGYDMEQSDVLYGNELEHGVTWNGSTDLGRWAGRPVRLRIRMQDADLYSFRFAD